MGNLHTTRSHTVRAVRQGKPSTCRGGAWTLWTQLQVMREGRKSEGEFVHPGGVTANFRRSFVCTSLQCAAVAPEHPTVLGAQTVFGKRCRMRFPAVHRHCPE